MKKPDGRALKRSLGARPERRVVRVLTEGTVTEPQYITALARANREVTVSIDTEHAGADPLRLVRAAKHQLAAARNRRSSTARAFDEIWCVFDVDNHAHLPDALAEALDAGINVAVSNPCFELWLILHVEQRTAWLDRHQAQTRARDLKLTSGKAVQAADTLIGLTRDAMARARWLEDWHQGNGSSSDANPSSGMWRLVEAVGHA